jgi:acetolactate synthase-1/2/3 large subunit
MLRVDRPVLFDCVVDPDENCYPMIPSGAAHNEMILCREEDRHEVSPEGRIMV